MTRSKLPSLLALLAAAGTACDASEPFTGADPTEPEIYYLSGVYFVPERSAVSTYAVDEAEWIIDGDRVTLAYHLPRLLVGGSERVAFQGHVAADDQTAELSGPKGSASCTLARDALPLSCLEEFVDIEVDLERVRDEASEHDPANLEARLDVSNMFISDPIGVFEPEQLLLGPVPLEPCDGDASCAGGVCDREDGFDAGYCEPIGELDEGADCAASAECGAGLDCEDGVCLPDD